MKRIIKDKKSLQLKLNRAIWFAKTFGTDLCPCFRIIKKRANK